MRKRELGGGPLGEFVRIEATATVRCIYFDDKRFIIHMCY